MNDGDIFSISKSGINATNPDTIPPFEKLEGGRSRSPIWVLLLT